MSVFNFIGEIFKPAANLIDELHFSGEEKGKLQTKLAEIEFKMAKQVLDLQSQLITANSLVAVEEQKHGNWLSKSWRPIVSLVMTGILVLMALEYVPFNNMLATLAGGFLGIYTGARSYEKRK